MQGSAQATGLGMGETVVFCDAWRAERVDRPGIGWPRGIAPVGNHRGGMP